MTRKRVLLIAAMAVALLVLVGGTALAQTYITKAKTFKFNKANLVGTALTMLVSNADGPVLTLDTDSTGSSATPLKLQTQTSSQAPMQVNSDTKVDNLNADKLDGMEASELQGGSIASITTINSPVGPPFNLGGTGTPNEVIPWKFVGDPETGITTTSSQRLVGSAGMSLGDTTPTAFNYDLCYRPSGGSTITNFSGNAPSSGTLEQIDEPYTATSSVVPGAGTWDVGFCVKPAGGPRDADHVSPVNGWVMVVNE